jgi:hypothetical protein
LPRHLDRPQADAQRQDIIEHVEGISNEGQGVDGVAYKELQEEEDAVDGQQDLDPAALGERHDSNGYGRGCNGIRSGGDVLFGVGGDHGVVLMEVEG